MKLHALWDPLRDMQRRPPVWLCPCCGQEQYSTDSRYCRAGRDLCARCYRSLGREEQEQYYETI